MSGVFWWSIRPCNNICNPSRFGWLPAPPDSSSSSLLCVAQLLRGILGLFLVILYPWHLMSQLCTSLLFFICVSIFNIISISSLISVDSAKTLVNLFITSKVDYCNSLLFGQPKCVQRDLQLFWTFLQDSFSQPANLSILQWHLCLNLHCLQCLPVHRIHTKAQSLRLKFFDPVWRAFSKSSIFGDNLAIEIYLLFQIISLVKRLWSFALVHAYMHDGQPAGPSARSI